jgi:hypothetical protein
MLRETRSIYRRFLQDFVEVDHFNIHENMGPTCKVDSHPLSCGNANSNWLKRCLPGEVHGLPQWRHY